MMHPPRVGIPLILLSAAVAVRAGDDLKDRGIFVLNVAGKQIGTETFEIAPRGATLEASAKIELRIEHDGKMAEFRTAPRLMLTTDLKPTGYEWSQKGAQSSELKLDVSGEKAMARYRTVSGAEDVREFVLDPGVIILDNNVIHHYQIALFRYRRAGGGKQSFRAFIPQEALPGALELEDAGPDRADVGGREMHLEHLVVTTDNARIDLWIDSNDRLQKLAIPAAQLEVFRKR